MRGGGTFGWLDGWLDGQCLICKFDETVDLFKSHRNWTQE